MLFFIVVEDSIDLTTSLDVRIYPAAFHLARTTSSLFGVVVTPDGLTTHRVSASTLAPFADPDSCAIKYGFTTRYRASTFASHSPRQAYIPPSACTGRSYDLRPTGASYLINRFAAIRLHIRTYNPYLCHFHLYTALHSLDLPPKCAGLGSVGSPTLPPLTPYS